MDIKQILSKTSLSPLDAEILLSYVLKEPREHLLAHPEKKLTKRQARKFNLLLRRRGRGEPIAYLRSRKEFYGLDFLVNKNVLIPRPETELLVEEVINKIFLLDPRWSLSSCNGGRDDKLMLIDIGTGSGNIIISIVKNIPEKIQERMEFYAVDLSEKALAVAKKNAKRHRVVKSIQFIKSDMLKFFLEKKMKLKGNVVIVANLPYVSPALYQKYRPGDLHFEPKKALLSENRGIRHYKNLLQQIKKILIPNHCYPIVVLEISPEQKLSLNKIIKDIFPKAKVYFQKDLAGKWRMAIINFA